MSKAYAELIFSSSNDDVEMMMVSHLLPITTFRLSPSNELTLLPTSTDLDMFFRGKHDTYTSSEGSNFFKIYGAISSCNSITVSFLYEYGQILSLF